MGEAEVHKKGKGVAVAVAAVCLAILAAGAAAWSGPLREAWYLRRLGSPDFDERLAAAERLGALRSIRAVPGILGLIVVAREDAPAPGVPAARWAILLEELVAVATSPPEDEFFMELRSVTGRRPVVVGPSIDFLHPDEEARLARSLVAWKVIRTAMETMGPEAVPALDRLARDPEADALVRKLAACEQARLVPNPEFELRIPPRGASDGRGRCAGEEDHP